jgi:hypothetical protein
MMKRLKEDRTEPGDIFKDRRKPNPEITPASENAPLGRWAFSQERVDVPFEVDTQEEKRLRSEFVRHFLVGGTMQEKDAQLIKSFLESGLYSDFFMKYDSGTLYRGMRVSGEYLARALGVENTHGLKKTGRKRVEGSLKFVPYDGRPITSWSEDASVSEKFSKESRGVGLDHGVFITARASGGTFFTVPEEDTPGGLSLEGESEALAIGPVEIIEIEWTLP